MPAPTPQDGQIPYPQAPEILPPDPAFAQAPSEPPRPQKRGWAYAPATYILVGINCAVFLAMVFSGVSLTSPTGNQLLHWGATYPAAVLYDGQWIRIVTAMFVHVGLIHLATNMWCLWNLGLLGEPLLGPFGLVAAYVLSGAAGNLLSVGRSMSLHHENIVGAGASGAVFGIAGVLIILLKSPRLAARVPAAELKALRRNVIYFAVLNFVIGFGGSFMSLGVNIDNMAHLGGLLGGLLFALPLVPRPGSPKSEFLFRRRLAVGLLTCVLVFFGVYLSAVFPAPPLPMQQ
jgi:rhomboid protease GluP